MEPQQKSENKSAALRRRAEAALHERPPDIQEASTEETDRLIHELHVHQIELEMQNEELRRVQLELEAARDKYADLFKFAPVGYLTVDENTRIREANLAAASLLGLDRSSLIGKPLHEFVARQSQDVYYQHRKEVFEKKDRRACEIKMVNARNTEFYVRLDSISTPSSHGESCSYRTALTDITEAHALSEEVVRQAREDALTGLINRREFEHRLERVLETARANKSEHALCYLDLDQFKVINDTCGHVAGDALLRQLAGVLQEHVRKRDTLARLGGDEFGVLLERCSIEQASRVANSLRRAVEEFRFLWEDRTFSLRVSIGLVYITEASESVVRVLGAADSACYAAKDHGRNRIHVYREDDAELTKRHGEMQWVARMQQALEENRFRLSFQPIVPCNGHAGERNYYELLLRLEGEDGNTILPGTFLPAAERFNFSTKLDRWVVDTALKWLAGHPEHVEHLFLCAINLSGYSLGDEAFLKSVLRQFDVTNVPAEKICFEITETVAISNLTSAMRFIKALKDRGCRFALDDFGSGLSSFGYLKHLPVDFLKIDGMFIKDIVQDPIDFAMVKSINDIGHVMGKQTIAEFVENDAILDMLREIGVDYVQGYAIDEPRPLGQMADSGPRMRFSRPTP